MVFIRVFFLLRVESRDYTERRRWYDEKENINKNGEIRTMNDEREKRIWFSSKTEKERWTANILVIHLRSKINNSNEARITHYIIYYTHDNQPGLISNRIWNGFYATKTFNTEMNEWMNGNKKNIVHSSQTKPSRFLVISTFKKFRSCHDMFGCWLLT